MSVFTLEELQKMDKNELITIIGNYISDQEIWLNKVAGLEKEITGQKAEIERLNNRIADMEYVGKGNCIDCKLVEDIETYDTKYKAAEEKIINLEEKIFNYEKDFSELKEDRERFRARNDELQKQVNELTKEKLDTVCDLNMRIVELDNELKQSKTLLEFREETIKYLEDANIRYAKALENKVKDTAKEILDKAITIDKNTGNNGFICIEALTELCKSKGVEVE